jgi:hypothetical protein
MFLCTFMLISEYQNGLFNTTQRILPAEDTISIPFDVMLQVTVEL